VFENSCGRDSAGKSSLSLDPPTNFVDHFSAGPTSWIMVCGCGRVNIGLVCSSLFTVVSPVVPWRVDLSWLATDGGAWVAVNKPWNGLWCGQLAGSRRVGRRARRAIQASTLIRGERTC
jgi:hypothetical protein